MRRRHTFVCIVIIYHKEMYAVIISPPSTLVWGNPMPLESIRMWQFVPVINSSSSVADGLLNNFRCARDDFRRLIGFEPAGLSARSKLKVLPAGLGPIGLSAVAIRPMWISLNSSFSILSQAQHYSVPNVSNVFALSGYTYYTDVNAHNN